VTDALVRVRLEGDEAVAGADRISSALSRIERGEPSRALRATRMAVDELTVAATGLHPVLGRLVATFTEFGVGGAIGLASVAGFAAIGLEVRALAGEADALDKKLLKLNTTFAQGTSAALIFAAAASQQQAEELDTTPGLWERILRGVALSQQQLGLPGGENALLGGASLVAAEQGRSSESVGYANKAAQQFQDLQDRRNAAQQKEIDQLDAAALAHDKAALGIHATTSQLDALARQADELRLRSTVLDPAERQRIENLLQETRVLDRQNIAAAQREADRARLFPFQSTTFDPNDIYNQARDANRALHGEGPTTPGMSRGELDAIRYRNAMLGLDENGRPLTATAPAPTDTGEKIGGAVARQLAASLPSLVGALSRSDAGGFLSAAGAGVEGLSSLRGLSAAGPIGLVLSTIGGLFSLFSSGGAKVSVETISDRAAKQLRDAQGVPQNVQVFLVDANGNVTQTAARIQHSERLGASKRFSF